MNLDELRKELDTKARQEVTQLRQHLEKTEERLKMKTDECNALFRQVRDLHCAPKEAVVVTDEKTAEVIAALSRRCYALSRGTMCFACTIQEYCRVEAIQSLRILESRIQNSL